MSISEILLFVATNSKASGPCVNFVMQNKLPIQFVRLDTEESRHTAANGRFFQITSVPTMAVFYEDGNTQLFTGTQKIIQWLTAMIKASAASSRASAAASTPEEPPNMYGPSNGGARRSLVPLIPRSSKTPQIDEGEDLNEEDSPVTAPQMRAAPRQPRATPRRIPTPVEEDDGGGEVNDEEPDEIEIEEPVPVLKPKARKPRAKSAKKTVKQRKPKKTTEDEVELVDDEEDPRRQAREKLNAVATAKSKPPPSRMKNLYAAAKQMEQDREASLGYNESELPHF